MLTEEKVIDQITIVESGHILVREATIIKRDGIEIARTFNRTSHSPDDDISKADEKVKNIANVVWNKPKLNNGTNV